MADVYVVLSDAALVDGVEYEAGAIVPIDDAISTDFGDELTQDHVGYTAAQWTSNNPTVNANHFGIESDTGLSKLGTGAAWNSTSYTPTTFTPDTAADLSSDYSTYATATPALPDTIVINDTSDGGNPKLVTLTQLQTLILD
jgi:hypothetical protein